MPRQKTWSKAAYPGDPAGFQLAVVNSCLWNEDVQLPRLPTPALLAPFYAQYESAAAASRRTASPWKNDYWCTKVAHVALGRHSALPAIYRLRHECAGRLHARVVYVQAAAVHRQLRKAYPPLPRSETHAITDGGVEDNDEVVIVEPTTRGVDAAADAADPPPPTVFTAPYYLLINHSENPIFVGPDRVPQGHSVVLLEGDVLSFLECAFDEDGGVLDGADVIDSEQGAEGQRGHTSVDTEAVDSAATMAEQVQQLAEESLWRCLDAPSVRVAPRPPSPAAHTIRQVRVPHRTVAIRRFYEVPHVIQEYMRWWHRHTTQPLEQRQVDGAHAASNPAESLSVPFSWMVSGNHLVRAPSIANSGLVSEEPVYTNAMGACGTAASTGMRSSSSSSCCSQGKGSCRPSTPPHMQQEQQQRFSEDLLHTPAVVTALHQWLKDTEEMEEVTEDVHSPLAALLVLDRAWLWRLVRCHHRQQATPRSQTSNPNARGSFSPSLVTLQESKATNTGLERPVAVKRQGGADLVSVSLRLGGSSSPQSASDDVAERFRISVPNAFENPVSTSDAASLALKATTSHGANVMQTMLEELRRSHRKEGGTDVAGTASDVGRPLCLDSEPIDVYASNTAHAATGPVSREASQWPLTSLPPMVSVGMPTRVPAVRIRPAALPVYVFTRRSRSPDVYTRERNSFAHTCLSSSQTGTRQARGAGAVGSTSGLGGAKQFVYYYYEADDHLSGDAAAAAEQQPPRPRGGTRGRGGRLQQAHERKTNGGGAVGGSLSAWAQPSPPVPSAAAPLSHDSLADASAADDSFLWIDEAEKAKEVLRATKTRKRRSSKKTAATRKRHLSEPIPSAAETKAFSAEGASVAVDESPATPTAKSTPSRRVQTAPRIDLRWETSLW
ncbi:hypothetical protein JIQ42_00836 [Leishmania sp. Namibia]|uniref:hypothetical protein n=1 Tax=Leishmania sp. Namibia TaxID=2802991 RepID=UPI001B5A01F0|nr:hypothetical protein JIQ42_00836 [Leishmania sp. Namibia]